MKNVIHAMFVAIGSPSLDVLSICIHLRMKIVVVSKTGQFLSK